jgi:acetoin utilization deacetylase AcuC-like enzyme
MGEALEGLCSGTENVVLLVVAGNKQKYQYISTHQSGIFPFSGKAAPEKEPFIVNIPFEETITRAGFRDALFKVEEALVSMLLMVEG